MTQIITKNSITSGEVPSSLATGELAINVADGKLFFGSASAVVEFTGSGSSNISSSYAVSSSHAETVTSASYAVTASYALNGGGGGGTPGGSDTQIQYNNGGTFAGVPVLVYSHEALSATGSFSGSFTGTFAGSTTTASYATTASYVLNAISASYAATASSADAFNVRTSLTASGLTYPTADGTYSSQVLQTNAAGVLTFGDVSTTFDNVYNAEATTLVKGTPVYVSGSQGANPKVYRADAAVSSKMPVIYIISENISSGNVGRGITLGHIEGIDLTGYSEGAAVYVAEGGGWTSTRPTGSNTTIQFLGLITKGGSGGKGLVLNPGPVVLPNLPSGSVWVGDNNNYPTAILTSSLSVATASYVLNAISSSYAATSATPITTTGSTIYSSTPSTSNVSSVSGLFLGLGAGSGAIKADYGIFLGYQAGYLATSASEAVYIGPLAGQNATKADHSVFIGTGAGRDAVSASYSTLIGAYAGWAQSPSTGIGNNNIIIGNYVTLPDNTKNSINIGAILFATGSYSTLGSAYSGSVMGKVGINKTNPQYNFDVSGSGNYSNGLTVTGSLTATSFTGSLLGTASWASNAVTASYILNATSASYAITASYVLNAISSSYAATASLAPNYLLISDTGSMLQPYVLTSATASMLQPYVLSSSTSSFVTNAQTSSMSVATASYVLSAVSSSVATNAASASAIQITNTTSTAGNYYPIFVAGTTTGIYLQPRVDSSRFIYNTVTDTLTVTSSYSNYAITASYVDTIVASASFAATASYVNTLNQNVLITGSLTIGSSSLGASENTLTLGARDAGSEGGQLMLQAPGGTYTSASMFDNYANLTRLLRGTNAGSDAVVASWNMHTKQMQLPQYTAASSFAGTATANLAVDSNGNVITVSTSGGTVFPYTGNAVITGSLTTTGIISVPINGAAYFRGGDDAELWDVNVANTIGIYGQQTQGIGAIKLGSGGPTLYGSGSRLGIGTTGPVATLDVNGNVYVASGITGSLQGTATTASYVTEFQHTTTGFSGNYMMPIQAYQNPTFTGGIADGTAVIRYYPFIPSANTRIASIGAVVRATSSPGTGSYRLGIYNSTDATVAGGPSKLPGSLLIDVGLISNTTITAAAVEIAIAVASQPTLQKGVVYWAAIAPSGSGTTCPGPNNNVVFNNYLGWSALGSAGLTPAIGITVNSDAGAGFAATAVTASYTFMNSTNVKMWPTFRISGSSV